MDRWAGASKCRRYRASLPGWVTSTDPQSHRPLLPSAGFLHNGAPLTGSNPNVGDAMSLFDLEGRVAIVTGGSQGLGRGIAHALADAGADIVIIARLPEAVTQGSERPHASVDLVVEELRGKGRKALGITADVREEGQVNGFVEKAISEFGRVDILVNNAGGSWGETFTKGPILEIGSHDMMEAYRLNVVSTFLCSRAVAPAMLEQGRGAIVNIASITGQGPCPGQSSYGAAKAAVISLTQTMASEWAPAIRVNAVAPSLVETPHRAKGGSGSVEATMLSTTPLARVGMVEEHSAAVAFLASDAAGYVTGTVLDVNGGRGA